MACSCCGFLASLFAIAFLLIILQKLNVLDLETANSKNIARILDLEKTNSQKEARILELKMELAGLEISKDTELRKRAEKIQYLEEQLGTKSSALDRANSYKRLRNYLISLMLIALTATGFVHKNRLQGAAEQCRRFLKLKLGKLLSVDRKGTVRYFE